MCNFGRGYYEKQFCEIILIWVSGSGVDVVLKISYLEFWLLSNSVKRNHLCNFERGIIRNIHVKLYEILTRGSGDGLKDNSDLEPFVQWTGNIRRHHGEQSCEIILNLDLWFRRKFRLNVFLI